jgi:EAL domain-containing protein (putative c-di-GMP-specific phosphodiesterase class I)
MKGPVSSDWIALDLVGAVARGEIAAHYQPQVSLVSGRIVAIETLSRWNHPERGMVAPDVFIPVAESTGLIAEIGAFMIEEGCREAVHLRENGHDTEVSVNVSAVQLATDAFYDTTLEVIERLSPSPASLTIEITESRGIHDLDLAVTRLDGLRSLGVGISVDDFGTGYSSIDQVLLLPATEVKIDRSITQDCSEEGAAVIVAAVALAREWSMVVVAEGVETEAQLDRVRDLGCDRAQGYLLGRPVSADEIDLLMSDDRPRFTQRAS